MITFKINGKIYNFERYIPSGVPCKFLFDEKVFAALPEMIQQDEQLILSDEERKKYTFESPFPQEFSLPSNIIYYVSRNPAYPNGHLKFILSCKYLLRMSRILPVKHMGYNCMMNFWDPDRLDYINFKKFHFKLWVYDKLYLWTESATLMKHIYKFSLQKITVLKSVLTFGELEILVSGSQLENVFFEKNLVKNSDGSVTEFEKIVELLSCEKMTIYLPEEQHGVGKNTANKIIEILSSEKVPAEMEFRLGLIPQSFDFNAFSGFLKANMTGRKHTIDLLFSAQISDVYKNQLQEFVDEIIQLRGIYAHTVPMLTFADSNEESGNQLFKMRHGTIDGILVKKPRTLKKIGDEFDTDTITAVRKIPVLHSTLLRLHQ